MGLFSKYVAHRVFECSQLSQREAKGESGKVKPSRSKRKKFKG
jgi:hypothetical protein